MKRKPWSATTTTYLVQVKSFHLKTKEEIYILYIYKITYNIIILNIYNIEIRL